MGDQLDLFGAPKGPQTAPAEAPAEAPSGDPLTEKSFADHCERHLEQKFEEFHTENPHVLHEMLRLARGKLAAGERRIGAKALWEELRSWLQTTGQPYKLNNSYTALYARELVKLEPRLEGVIEMRRRKS